MVWCSKSKTTGECNPLVSLNIIKIDNEPNRENCQNNFIHQSHSSIFVKTGIFYVSPVVLRINKLKFKPCSYPIVIFTSIIRYGTYLVWLLHNNHDFNTSNLLDTERRHLSWKYSRKMININVIIPQLSFFFNIYCKKLNRAIL